MIISRKQPNCIIKMLKEPKKSNPIRARIPSSLLDNKLNNLLHFETKYQAFKKHTYAMGLSHKSTAECTLHSTNSIAKE